ncbi:MAG: hypothetical protein SNH07_00475 [Rikenellaceae bacterium]
MKNLLIGVVVCLVCALAVSLLFNLGVIETSSKPHHIVESKTVLDPKYKVDIRAEYNDTEKVLVEKFNNYAVQQCRIINKNAKGEAVTEDDKSKLGEAGYYFLTFLESPEIDEYLVRESLMKEIATKIEKINNEIDEQEECVSKKEDTDNQINTSISTQKYGCVLSYTLQDRDLIKPPVVSSLYSNETGCVEFSIIVDETGQIISTSFNADASTINNTSLIGFIRECTFKSKFSTSSNFIQSGIILYEFKNDANTNKRIKVNVDSSILTPVK